MARGHALHTGIALRLTQPDWRSHAQTRNLASYGRTLQPIWLPRRQQLRQKPPRTLIDLITRRSHDPSTSCGRQTIAASRNQTNKGSGRPLSQLLSSREPVDSAHGTRSQKPTIISSETSLCMASPWRIWLCEPSANNCMHTAGL